MNKDNKHIEKFFSKHLEDGSFQFREEDWKALSAKMDAAGMVAPENKNAKKRVLFWLFISLLSFAGGYMTHSCMFSCDNQAPHTAANPNTTTTQREHAQTSLASLNKQNNHKQSNRSKTLLDVTPKTPVSEDVPISEDKTTSEDSFHPTKSPNAVKLAASSALTGTYEQSPTHASEAGKIEQAPTTAAPETQTRKNNILDSVDNKPWVPIPTSLHKLDTVPLTPSSKQHSQFKKRLWVELALAPEYNSVRLGQQAYSSFRQGLSVGFTLNKHISVSTGIYYNTKRYVTSRAYYNAPMAYWEAVNNGVVADRIDGKLKTLDFPINIHFESNKAQRLNWGISGGISNYIILNENCTFEYDLFDPNNETGWESKRSSTVWAGVVNITPSLRYQINDKTSLLVSPYLKIPIADIGWGAVDLYSSGINIAIRQHLFYFN